MLDLPRIPLPRTPHLITVDAPARRGAARRTHVAAVWGDLDNASAVIVQPMSNTVTTDEQTWHRYTVKTSLLASGLARNTALVQWLGRTALSRAGSAHHRRSDDAVDNDTASSAALTDRPTTVSSSTDMDPLDRDADNLLEFDRALGLALADDVGRAYLGYGPGGYLIAEACKRGLAPSALAFVDTPGLGRQARRAADGTPMIAGGTLIHAREPITCMRELNPAIADIPVLVLGDGSSVEFSAGATDSTYDDMAYSSPPQHLSDVIVATTRSEEIVELLPRSATPAQLRKYVFDAQRRRATTSSEAQRNLLAFLNGQLHLIRAANRLESADAKPTLPGTRLLRVPAVPLFNREHTGDNAPRRNTRPRVVRNGCPRPPSKPDGYHARASARRF